LSEAFLKQSVEVVFRGLIEGGGGLVEKEIVRRVQERARNAEPLLLAG
jgi:hypothetical protein